MLALTVLSWFMLQAQYCKQRHPYILQLPSYTNYSHTNHSFFGWVLTNRPLYIDRATKQPMSQLLTEIILSLSNLWFCSIICTMTIQSKESGKSLRCLHNLPLWTGLLMSGIAIIFVQLSSDWSSCLSPLQMLCRVLNAIAICGCVSILGILKQRVTLEVGLTWKWRKYTWLTLGMSYRYVQSYLLSEEATARAKQIKTNFNIMIINQLVDVRGCLPNYNSIGDRHYLHTTDYKHKATSLDEWRTRSS